MLEVKALELSLAKVFECFVDRPVSATSLHLLFLLFDDSLFPVDVVEVRVFNQRNVRRRVGNVIFAEF